MVIQGCRDQSVPQAKKVQSDMQVLLGNRVQMVRWDQWDPPPLFKVLKVSLEMRVMSVILVLRASKAHRGFREFLDKKAE